MRSPWPRAPTLREDHESHLSTDPAYRRKWRKFNVYCPERAAFDIARRFRTSSGRGNDFPDETQSLEASIMEAADEITYAIHDLEDCTGAGAIPVGQRLRPGGDGVAADPGGQSG
ncbi:dGTP triphosphohydrolase [Crossiella cryophila]|uniref:dGTP triphosphohydrolase n=1 Tax=Crossiella cryophila TaxID=43355 RepID=A0A7W7FTP1_9PSEU|nr:dGTP triphosphohydrolase [Crossiella cryophila]